MHVQCCTIMVCQAGAYLFLAIKARVFQQNRVFPEPFFCTLVEHPVDGIIVGRQEQCTHIMHCMCETRAHICSKV